MGTVLYKKFHISYSKFVNDNFWIRNINIFVEDSTTVLLVTKITHFPTNEYKEDHN